MGSPPPHEINASESLVEVWSDVRLPFQPREDGARRLRDAVGEAVCHLARRPVLRAVYRSADPTPCDVENVALYNVGGEPFRGLGTDALLVERPRGFSPRAPSGAALSHYFGYESLASVEVWRTWKAHRKLVSWRAAPVEGPFTATNVWAALKRGEVTPLRTWDGVRPLGVVVRLPGDRSPVSSVKAAVDGVVAAAHCIEGADVAELGSLVSMALRSKPQTTTGWLTDRALAVLGPRRLVVPRAGTFQWNPADDQVAALRVERFAGSMIEAEIWTLAPVVPD